MTAQAQNIVEALPKKRPDLLPLLLPPILALCAYPLVDDLNTWITLTIAGVGMGLIVFLMASGLTLVFGLMDVMNFGHGIFITLGAYMGVTVLAPLQDWVTADDLGLNLLALAGAAGVGMLVTAAIGFVFERLIVRPVYGSHLTQILVTSGGLIISEQLILALWGADAQPLIKPAALAGAYMMGDVAVEKLRLLSMALGLAVFVAMLLILNRTRLGLLIRASVQDREMAEALGYKVKYLFVAVFVAGAALAALGGLFWGINQDGATVHLGGQMMVLVFIVLIIGGMGSVGGAFLGAILVGLLANYTGFVVPKAAAFANIGLMCLVILWRPQGLYPVAKR